MEAFGEGERTVTAPFECGHAACLACDAELYRRHHDRCPQCRADRLAESERTHGRRAPRPAFESDGESDGERIFIPITRQIRGLFGLDDDGGWTATTDLIYSNGRGERDGTPDNRASTSRSVSLVRVLHGSENAPVRRLAEALIDVPGGTLAAFAERAARARSLQTQRGAPPPSGPPPRGISARAHRRAAVGR